jgi:hypothetical protein
VVELVTQAANRCSQRLCARAVTETRPKGPSTPDTGYPAAEGAWITSRAPPGRRRRRRGKALRSSHRAAFCRPVGPQSAAF